MKKNCFLLLILVSTHLMAQDALFDVLNSLSGVSAATSQGTSSLSLNKSFTARPASTWWSGTTLSESDVFHGELVHSSSTENWTVRIGNGGQIYSWNVTGVGEILPKCGSNTSPWMDDIIMTTFRDVANHGDSNTYTNGFIHGAGMYISTSLDPLNNKPFYCPMFAEKFSNSDRTYSCINWGVVPTPSVNRSDVLFYNQYKFLGAGVLEITYYAYNFGTATFKDNTWPWGMMRDSVFPEQIRSKSTGSGYELFEGYYPTRFNLIDQGGWVGKTANINSTSAFSMANVHGKDRHYGESWQTGKSWSSIGTSPVVNSTRDMSVFTCANNTISITPGRGFYFRTYIVVGNLGTVSAEAYSLVDKVDYGFVDISEFTSSALLPLYKTTLGGQSVLTAIKPSTTSTPVCKTYALPVKNSVPLFLLKNTVTGTYYLSTDQQALVGRMTVSTGKVYQSYDGKTEWVSLLGYVMPTSKATITTNTATLSSKIGSTYAFTAGEKYASSAILVRTDVGTYEAEHATITAGDIKHDAVASGAQYIDGSEGFKLAFGVSETGSATLSFNIKSPSGSRSMGVYVNGTKVGTITTSLSTWNTKTVTATLPSGTKSVELRDSEGTAELDVDNLKVVLSSAKFSDSKDDAKFVMNVNTDISETTDKEVAVYPNPVKEILNVKIGSSKTATLAIFNSKGQKVLSQEINEENTAVNVSSLPLGIYIVKITSESGEYTKKIVKE